MEISQLLKAKEINYTPLKSLHTTPRNKTISGSLPALKKAVWLYFFLLLFEGGLRRWVLPGLAAPLLVIRDPLALWMIFVCFRKRLIKENVYLIGIASIGLIGFITALLTGHGNIAVAAFGARILIIYFPLMFVIGNVFNRKDVLKLGKTALWISLPMTILIAIQFYSPQSAWVNRGVGGDVNGAGFSGALGFFRPPGTFSFITGTTQFYGLVTCFVLIDWLNAGNNRLLLIASTISILAAIPLSLSRSLFFQVAVSIIFTAIAISRRPKYLLRMLVAVFGIAVLFSVLSNVAFFQTATEVFTARFMGASEAEGGVQGTLIDRYLGGLIGAFQQSDNLPFFGLGIGMGTNVGAQLLAGDKEVFLISEGEWGRLIGELGAAIGILVIFFRLTFCIKLTRMSYMQLVRGDALPWLLLSFGILIIPQGQWAQPATLGFSTLIGGLILASINLNKNTIYKN